MLFCFIRTVEVKNNIVYLKIIYFVSILYDVVYVNEQHNKSIYFISKCHIPTRNLLAQMRFFPLNLNNINVIKLMFCIKYCLTL